MLEWHLSETYQTTAGRVAAGRCGAGPALILAHGWPWSSFSWHRIIPALAQHFEVHWYDMVGYGASEMDPDQRTSLDVQGIVFKEMMAHWNLAKPNVIAHDFGGAVTLRAHLLHDCAFERYVLMNVVAMRPWGSDFFGHVGKHVAAFQGLPPHIHAAIVDAYIKGALVNDLTEADFTALAAPWKTAKGAGSFYRQFAQADEAYTATVEPLFGDIRCPTQVIWGAQDPWIPVARGEALSQLIGQSRLQTLNGVGHLPQLEAPEAVIKVVLEFLKGEFGPRY